jgi:hypothetical protein
MGSIRKSLAMILLFLFLMPLITLQQTTIQGQLNNATVSIPRVKSLGEYGFDNVESVSNLIQTSDGGFAFMDLGWSYQITFEPSTVFKVDSSGITQWRRTIDFFKGSTIVQTSDNGYEIAGEWSTYGIPNQHTLNIPTIIKTDSQGKIQWVENYSSALSNLGIASTRIQTSDGGLVYTESGSIIKTDSSNNMQWIKNLTYSTIGYTFPLVLSSLVETSDGAIAGLGVGYQSLSNPRTGAIYLIKTDPFLPLPSQSPLPTPLASPTPTPFMITVNAQILIIALVAVVVALRIVLLIYRKHRKTTDSGSQENLTEISQRTFTSSLLSPVLV